LEWNKKILRFRFVLFPLALFYWATVFWRNVLYNYKFFISRKLPTKIISVGNITTGGTGKTPAVIYLAKNLLEKNYSIAILSRGYGRKTAGTQLVTDGKNTVNDWRNFGDEATLMSQKLKGVPIVVDENRYRGGLLLIDKFKPDIIILDDGFQHRSLERDVDIVLLNCQDQREEHKMIPYGKLREPRRHLNRADMLILTKTNLIEPSAYLKRLTDKFKPPTYNSSVCCNKLLTSNDQTMMIDENISVLAISGIADTQSFHKTLERAGINVCETITFIDHHNYVQKDIDEILNKAQNCNADIIVTTEKDMVKLKNYDFDKFMLYSLEIEFQIDIQSEQKLFDIIERKISI
tara:strand:- start:721 stop:1767 length:1047 start_codon:yes stop_codon:yes gene_type:complete